MPSEIIFTGDPAGSRFWTRAGLLATVTRSAPGLFRVTTDQGSYHVDCYGKAVSHSRKHDITEVAWHSDLDERPT